MSDEEPSPAGPNLKRREVLAMTGTGGTVGLAGCSSSNVCELTLDKRADGELNYGQQATYVFEVCSTDTTGPFSTAGTCDQTITIVDDLPNNISFVSVSGSGGGTWMSSVSGNTVELTNDSYGDIGDGTPSECLTAEMTVQIATAAQFSGPAPHDVENCADLEYDGNEYRADCVPNTITHDDCDLSFEKDVADEFQYGQEAAYVYEVCNEGDTTCTGTMEVEDNLPDGISFVATGGGWTANASGGVVTATNDSYGGLDPGECLTLEVVVQVASMEEFPGETPVQNCAFLSHEGEQVTEDCVTHDVGDDTGDGPCPPVAFDLNSGYDQDTDATLGDGVDDDDWTITVDQTAPGSVPKQATVVNQSDIPGNWPVPFADSRWVSRTADASYVPPPNSTYEYEYCFCLREGFHDPELDLQVRADNTITGIRLNGTALNFDGNGGFQSDPIEEVYTDPEPFQAGENCLTLVLENEVGSVGLNVAGTMTAQNADCDCTLCAPTLSKEVADEFHYGQQTSYLFTVCNEGEAECTEAFDVVDDLPDGISFVSAGGNWSGSVSGGEVTVTNDSYGGLAPGECIDFEMTVEVADQDAFPGDPPSEVENCAELTLDGESVAEDCVTHDITVDEDPCPPVAFDLATGYDQANDEALSQGDDDEDWTIVVDGTSSGPVPRPATKVNFSDPLPDSQWIAHSDDGSVDDDEPTVVYEYCFCLNGGFTDPELDLQAQADDEIADIELNGDSLSFAGSGSFQDEPIEEVYTDPDLFAASDNCLTITVDDTEGFVSGLNVAGTMTAQNADCDCGEDEPTCEFFFDKDTAGEFNYGQQATYVFEICSDPDLSDGECTGPLSIEDDLPDGISFVDVSGDWTATISGGVVEASNDSYSGLDPGECLSMEMIVDVADADEFPGDESTNCATLFHEGENTGEDCVTHEVHES